MGPKLSTTPCYVTALTSAASGLYFRWCLRPPNREISGGLMTQGWAVATGRHNRVTWGRRKRRIICPSSVHCSSLICLLARPDRCAPFSCAQCDVSFCASLFLALMNLFFFPPSIHHLVSCPRFTLSHGCHILDHVPLARSLWPVSVPSPSSFHVTLCLFFPIVPPPKRKKKTKKQLTVCARPLPVEDHRVHGSARCNGRQ